MHGETIKFVNDYWRLV